MWILRHAQLMLDLFPSTPILPHDPVWANARGLFGSMVVVITGTFVVTPDGRKRQTARDNTLHGI